MKPTNKTALAKKLRQNQTNAEQKFWHAVKARRLGGYKFKRQVPIGNFIVDFVCEQKKVIVELDGAHHADQVDADKLRSEQLGQFGYHVIRIWNQEIYENLAGVLDTLLDQLDSLNS